MFSNNWLLWLVNSFDFILFFNLCSSPHAFHNHILVKIPKSTMANSISYLTRWVYKTILCNTLNQMKAKISKNVNWFSQLHKSNISVWLTKQRYSCDNRNVLFILKLIENNSPTCICSIYETSKQKLMIEKLKHCFFFFKVKKILFNLSHETWFYQPNIWGK